MGVQRLAQKLDTGNPDFVKRMPMNQIFGNPFNPDPPPPPPSQDDQDQDQDDDDIEMNEIQLGGNQVQTGDDAIQVDNPAEINFFNVDIASEVIKAHLFDIPSQKIHIAAGKMHKPEVIREKFERAREEGGRIGKEHVKAHVEQRYGWSESPVGLVFDGKRAADKHNHTSIDVKDRSVNLEHRLTFMALKQFPMLKEYKDGQPPKDTKITSWHQFKSMDPEAAKEDIESGAIIGRVRFSRKNLKRFNKELVSNISNLLTEGRARQVYEAFKKESPDLCLELDLDRDQGEEFQRIFDLQRAGPTSIAYFQAPLEADPVLNTIVNAAINFGHYQPKNIFTVSPDSDLLVLDHTRNSHFIQILPPSESQSHLPLKDQIVRFWNRYQTLRHHNISEGGIKVATVLIGKDGFKSVNGIGIEIAFRLLQEAGDYHPDYYDANGEIAIPIVEEEEEEEEGNGSGSDVSESDDGGNGNGAGFAGVAGGGVNQDEDEGSEDEEVGSEDEDEDQDQDGNHQTVEGTDQSETSTLSSIDEEEEEDGDPQIAEGTDHSSNGIEIDGSDQGGAQAFLEDETMNENVSQDQGSDHGSLSEVQSPAPDLAGQQNDDNYMDFSDEENEIDLQDGLQPLQQVTAANLLMLETDQGAQFAAFVADQALNPEGSAAGSSLASQLALETNDVDINPGSPHFTDEKLEVLDGLVLEEPTPASKVFLSHWPDTDEHNPAVEPYKKNMSRLLRCTAWKDYTKPRFTHVVELLIYCLLAWMGRGFRWNKEKINSLIERGSTKAMAEAELLNELVEHMLRLLNVLVTNRQVPARDSNTISSQLTEGQKGRIRRANEVPESIAFFSGTRAQDLMVSDQSTLEPQYRMGTLSESHPYSKTRPSKSSKAYRGKESGKHPRVLHLRKPILAPIPGEPVRERPSRGNGAKVPTAFRTDEEERALALVAARKLASTGEMSKEELNQYEDAASSNHVEVASASASKTRAKKKDNKSGERAPTFKGGTAYASASFSGGHGKSERNKGKGRGTEEGKGKGKGRPKGKGKEKASEAVNLKFFEKFQGVLSRFTIHCNIHSFINESLRPHATTMVEAARAQKLLGTIRFKSLHNTLELVLSPSFSATPEGTLQFSRWATLLFECLGENYQAGIESISTLLFHTDPSFEGGSGHVDLDENTGGSKVAQLLKIAAPGVPTIKQRYDNTLLKDNCSQMASYFHCMYANKAIPILLGHLRNLLKSSDLGKEFELAFEVLFPKNSGKSKKQGLFALLALVLFASTEREDIGEDEDEEEEEDENGDLDLSPQDLSDLENEKEKQRNGLKGLQDAYAVHLAPALGGEKFDLSRLHRARLLVEKVSNFHDHNHAKSQQAISILSEALFHFQHSFNRADSCLSPTSKQFKKFVNLFSSSKSSRISCFLIAFRLCPKDPATDYNSLLKEPLPPPKKHLPDFSEAVIRMSMADESLVSAFSRSLHFFTSAARAMNVAMESFFAPPILLEGETEFLRSAARFASTYVEIPVSKITQSTRRPTEPSSRGTRRREAAADDAEQEEEDQAEDEDEDEDPEAKRARLQGEREFRNDTILSGLENRIKAAKEMKQALSFEDGLPGTEVWKDGQSPFVVLEASIRDAEEILELCQEWTGTQRQVTDLRKVIESEEDQTQSSEELGLSLQRLTNLSAQVSERYDRIKARKVELHPNLEKRSKDLTEAYQNFAVGQLYSKEEISDFDGDMPSFDVLKEQLKKTALQVRLLRSLFNRNGGLHDSLWTKTFTMSDHMMAMGGFHLGRLKGQQMLHDVEWNQDGSLILPVNPSVLSFYQSLDPDYGAQVNDYLHKNFDEEVLEKVMNKPLAFDQPPVTTAPLSVVVDDFKKRTIADDSEELLNTEEEANTLRAFAGAKPTKYHRLVAVKNAIGAGDSPQEVERVKAEVKKASRALREETQIRREDCGSTAANKAPLSSVAPAADPDDPLLIDCIDRNGKMLFVDGGVTKQNFLLIHLTKDKNGELMRLLQGATFSNRTPARHSKLTSHRVTRYGTGFPNRPNLTRASRAYADSLRSTLKVRRAQRIGKSWRKRIVSYLEQEVWEFLGCPTAETSPRPTCVIGDGDFRKAKRLPGMPDNSFVKLMEPVIRNLKHCIHFIRTNEFLSSQSIPVSISTREEREADGSHEPFIEIAQVENDPADLIGRRRPRAEWPMNGAGKRNTKIIKFKQKVWADEEDDWKDEVVLMQRDLASCLIFDFTLRHMLKYRVTPNATTYAPKVSMLSKVRKRKRAQRLGLRA